MKEEQLRVVILLRAQVLTLLAQGALPVSANSLSVLPS